MKRAILGLVAAGMVLAATPVQASTVRVVQVTGLTPYLTVVENANHGPLVKLRNWYADGYVHGTLLPRGSAVRDLEHFTCVNPESHGPTCAAFPTANDQLLTSDPETVGTPGQQLTGVHHNASIDFQSAGTGTTLQWRTYEHGKHTRVELFFADGFELCVMLDHPTHLNDIRLTTQPAVAGAVSHAMTTATEKD